MGSFSKNTVNFMSNPFDSKDARPPIEAYEIVNDDLIVPDDYTVTKEHIEKLYASANQDASDS